MAWVRPRGAPPRMPTSIDSPGTSGPAASSRVRSSAIGWRGSPRSSRRTLLRRRRALRLRLALRVVRRPRRIALARALLAPRHLEQPFQRAARIVDAVMAVAHALEA